MKRYLVSFGLACLNLTIPVLRLLPARFLLAITSGLARAVGRACPRESMLGRLQLQFALADPSRNFTPEVQQVFAHYGEFFGEL